MTDTPDTPGAAAVPEALLPMSWLIGTWVGVGLGTYPTFDNDFRFGQEVTFSTDGRPFLSYSSRSWLLDDDGNQVRPLASETGFWRPLPDNGVEVLLTHSIGYVETYDGKIEVTQIGDVDGKAVITGARVQLQTDIVARSQNAKEYEGGIRLYGLIEGDLGWAFDMAAVGEEMTNHLSARLAKIS